VNHGSPDSQDSGAVFHYSRSTLLIYGDQMKLYLFSMIAFLCLFTLACGDKESNGDHKWSSAGPAYDTASINSLNQYAIKLVQKDPDSALFYLNQTLQQSDSIDYLYGTGRATYFIGLAYFYKYQYDTALFLHQKAYRIFEEMNNKKGMAQALYSMSYDYSLKQNIERSKDCMENARSILEGINDYTSVYDCIEGLIFLHKQLHHDIEVDSLIRELVYVAERTGDKKRMANSYYTLGNHYFDQAYLQLAIEAFYRALKIAEESGDPAEIANVLGSIGLTNLYLQEYQTAIEYYLKQEAILRDLNDNYQLSNTYTGLGEACIALKNYREGLEYHLEALRLRQDMNYEIAISNSLHNIGLTYFLMEDCTALALKYVNESLEINNRIKNYNGLAKNYMVLGKIHAQKVDHTTAIKLLEQALSLAQEYNYPDVVMESSASLSDLYAQEKNYEKAFTSILKKNQISDSIVSGENFKRITQLEMQYAFDKEQNEIEVGYQQERLRYEAELRRNKITRNFILLTATLLIAFGIFLYFNYRKSRRAEKEKEILLKEIHHRVKNNLMVISSLLNLQSGSITDEGTRSAVKESQNRVKSMALIHQMLYQSGTFNRIDFPKYLEQLMASLKSTYSGQGKNIQYVIKTDDIQLDIDTAIPLGLITNELATNAYKYAFTDSSTGRIEVDFNHITNHKYRLRVSDNGIGLPEGFNVDRSTTLGLKLVKILSRQLKAKLEYTVMNGTEFNIEFSDES